MASNRLISQNSDLIIMMLVGILMYVSQTYYITWEFNQQLFVLGVFAFISGLFMSRGGQLIEWFLCFLFGGLLATTIAIAYSRLPLLDFPPQVYYEPLLKTSVWYFYLLLAFMIGLPAGSMVNRMLVGNYWYRKTFYILD